MIALPEHKLGIVVLANSAEARSGVNKVATEILKEALQAKTGIVQPEKKSSLTTAKIDPQPLDAYTGSYTSLAGLARITRERGDHLKLHAFGKKLRLINAEDGRLRLQYRLLGLIPISLDELDDVRLELKDVSGHPVLAASLYGKEIYAGEKLTPTTIPDTWRQRAGEYRIVNPGKDHTLLKDIHLVVDDDLIVLELTTLLESQVQRIPLLAISDTECINPGLFSGQGETIRVINSPNGERLRYSGYLFEKTSSNRNPRSTVVK